MGSKIRQFLTNHRFEAFIFLLAFVLHSGAGILLYLKYGGNMLIASNEDAIDYLSMGKNLASGEGFKMHDIVTAVRTPFYPLFLSLFYLFRSPLLLIAFFQNIIFSFAAVLIYRTGKILFSDFSGKIASLILAIEPYLALTTNLATTETVFIFLIAAFVYYFGRWCVEQEAKKTYLFLSALFLGLAVLTRPVAVYLPALVIFLMLVQWFYRKDNFKSYLASSALFLAIFFAVLSPWLIRQYLAFGVFRLSTIDTFMLYTRITPIAVADKLGVDYNTASRIFLNQLPEKIPDFDPIAMEHTFKYDEILNAEAKELILSHWPAVARFYAMSLFSGLFGTGYDYMLEDIGFKRKAERISFTETLLRKDVKKFLNSFFRLDIFQIVLIASALVWLVFYIFMTVGIFHSVVSREKFLGMVLILSLAVYFIFFALGPQCHARYRLPSYPFLLLLLGFGLDAVFNKKFILSSIYVRLRGLFGKGR